MVPEEREGDPVGQRYHLVPVQRSQVQEVILDPLSLGGTLTGQEGVEVVVGDRVRRGGA